MPPDRTADRARVETDERTLAGRRVVLGLGVALVGATAAFGAVLGYALPAWTGTETIVVAGFTLLLSPVTMALYGAVSVGTFFVTLLLVLRAISRFDENAV